MQRGVEISYTVSVRNSPPEVHISCSIENIGQPRLAVQTPAQSNLMNVTDFEAKSIEGEDLRHDYLEDVYVAPNVSDRLKSAKWLIDTNGNSKISVSYRVALGYKDRGEHYGYIGEKFGLLSGYNLFLVPDVQIRLVKAEFEVPEGWDVVLPRQSGSHGNQKDILSKSITSVLKAVIGVGPFELTRFKLPRTDIFVYTYADWPLFHRKTVAENAFEICKRQIEMLGDVSQINYTSIFTPRTPESESIFVPASVRAQGRCMEPATQTDWIHFAEHFFKRYTTYGERKIKFADTRNKWYGDGIAGFYGIRALDVIHEHGRTSENRLLHLYNIYAASLRHGRNTSTTPTIPRDTKPFLDLLGKTSSRQQIEYRRIRAPVMVYLLDRLIRHYSNGFQNLDDLMEHQFLNSRQFSKPIDLAKDLLAVTGRKFEDFFEKRVFEINFTESPTYLPFIDNPIPTRRRHYHGPSSAQTKRMSLIVTGSTESYLENCGCAIDQSGGIARRATAIKQIRSTSSNVLLLDVGDTFPALVDYDKLSRLEVETYLKAMNSIGFHALNVSANEIMASKLLPDIEKSLSFPVVSANLVTGRDAELVYRPFVVHEVNELKIGIIGISPTFPMSLRKSAAFDFNSAHMDFLESATAVEKSVSSLRSTCDLIILMAGSTYPHVIYDILEKVKGIDLVVSTNRAVFHAYDYSDLKKGYVYKNTDGFVGNTLMIYVQQGPYGVEWVELEVLPKNGIVNWGKNSMKLTEEISDDPQVRQILDSFFLEVRENANNWNSKDRLFENEALERTIARGNSYVGVGECTGCHKEIAQEWGTTAHATAYNTLVKVHRNYYPRCIVCHTVGFGHDSGFKLDTSRSLELAGVQCETCHGPGRRHIEYAKGIIDSYGPVPEPKYIRRTVSIDHCKACHNLEHSPRFNYVSHIHQGCSPKAIGTERVRMIPPAFRPQHQSPVEGKAIYQETGCARCHGPDRNGGSMGPALKDLRSHWNQDELNSYISNPSVFREKSPRLKALSKQFESEMPSYALDDTTLNRLITYLLE